MAQQHQLNGTNINYINRPDWEDKTAPQAHSGAAALQRWRRHTWQAQAMPMDEFDFIYALEGQKVSLTTNDYDDRNGDYVTYYGADLERVEGQHESVNMSNVQITFLVRV